MTAHSHQVPPQLYLAIDQGGHASRALVFDDKGDIRAHGERPVKTYHGDNGQVEQDAAEVLASVSEAVAEVMGQLGTDSARVTAAALATQRSSNVCWDKRTGQALSPVVSWQDRRTASTLSRYLDAAPRIRHKTGLLLSAHYGATKLRWCLDHLPAVRAAAAAQRLAWGPLASYLCFNLLEARPHLVDPANASRTLLWNIETRDWDADLLALFGLPPEALPRCVPTRHAFGKLRIHGTALPLHIVTGDQSAALYGFGQPRPDTVYINLGTGAFLQCPSTIRPGITNLLASVAYADENACTYVREGTVNGAGSALAQASRDLGIETAYTEARLEAWLQEIATPPLFLNGISGLGSPYWRADYRSRFIGEASAEARMVAVAESILFLLKVNLEELSADGYRPARLLVTGGLARLNGLCQRLADLSGVEVFRPAITEATARGLACLLQGGADGMAASLGERFAPSPSPPLHGRYQHWRQALEASLQ